MRRVDKNERSTLDQPLLNAVGESEMTAKAEGGREEQEAEAAGGSPCRTALNIANTLEGMGLLGLPYAVRLAGGYAGGAVVLVCIISAYTAVVISSSLYAAQCTTPRWPGDAESVIWIRKRSSYVANARSAFGASGGVVVMVMQLFTLTSVTAIFLVLVGDSMAGIMPQIISKETLARSPLVGDKLWVVLAWAGVVPTAWIRSLRQVSWLSGACVNGSPRAVSSQHTSQ
jgi:vesicular inhibitory amino acid transporter